MCGIAGFADFTKKSSQVILEQMACAVAHRGPDGQGVFFNEIEKVQVGLGHRRLSIIDLSTDANQPMHYNGLHLIFNGEIYNYNEIRDQLIKKGHQFKTHSDTEVILHSWEEWGEKSIDQWHGMFTIALLDEKNEELICIRDRAGVKPFYYYYNEGLYIFSSELKSITAHPNFIKRINRESVASFLQYGYISYPHCIYQNTFKLPPAHLLRLNLNTGQKIISQYWNVYDAYNQPKLDISFAEAKVETEKILKKAFDYRMVADVPVGVFLSGGFDSSCVTALLQKDSKEKIKTFTIGTTDSQMNEAPFAKEIANHLGTDHNEYYCTSKEALEVIPDLPYYYDEPFADSSAIPTILVSRMARKKVTVALSADAGDEIFAGYNRYDYLSKYGNTLNKIPGILRKAVAGVMDSVSSENIPYFNRTSNFHSRYKKVKNLLLDPSPDEMMKNLNHVFNNDEIHQLFKEDVKELPTRHVTSDLTEEFYDPLSYMMAVDYETYMVDDILQKVDRATMSVSLEGREPFLDQSIIEWAAKLPNNYKYHNGQKKYIIKHIVYDYIPKEIMERKKMGFAIPVQTWLKNELKELVMDYLDDKNLDKHGLFNKEYVHKTIKAFFNGHTDHYLKIWYLLMFQMWFRKWMGTNQ